MLRTIIPRKLRYTIYDHQKLILGLVVVAVLYILYTKSGSKTSPTHTCPNPLVAKQQTDLQDLLDILIDPDDRKPYAWTRMRIQTLWPKWVKTARAYLRRTKLQKRSQKQVLVFIGALSTTSRRNLAENQFKGGYLGELVQWSDIVTCLYLLGHHVTVISDTYQLSRFQRFFTRDPCTLDESVLIYTDIFGVRQIQRTIEQPYIIYKCRLRVLDVFGTDPAWNNKLYAYKHNRTSYWGGLDLNPRQFYTMYPENPDNSFLGYSVYSDFDTNQVIEKENIGVIYGKTEDVLKGKLDYLRIFHEAGFKLHATIFTSTNEPSKESNVPSFITNHGPLVGEEFRKLLTKAKIFIGLGSPIEGPAPLEAIAHGAVYINPKFVSPVNLTSRGRATERFFSSQTPYAEKWIGEPYVYTIPIDSVEVVRRTVYLLAEQKRFQSFLPYEFTQEGFLQRLNIYLEKQIFCDPGGQIWPPLNAVTFQYGDLGASCRDTCWNQGLLCEPNHFQRINSFNLTSPNTDNYRCAATRKAPGIWFPAIQFDSMTCILQRNPDLYSCAGSSDKYIRLCPCRNYIKGQIALCKNCDL